MAASQRTPPHDLDAIGAYLDDDQRDNAAADRDRYAATNAGRTVILPTSTSRPNTPAPGVLHAIDVEQWVLGSILAGWAPLRLLHPDDYYDPRHHRIATATRALAEPLEPAIIERTSSAGPVVIAALAALQPHLAHRDHIYAATIATAAPTVGRRDAAWLRTLRYRRDRAARLTAELTTLTGRRR